MSPALEVTDLSTHIKLSRSIVQAVGNVDVSDRRRRDGRAGRRVGLRQVDARPVGARAAADRRPHRRRLDQGSTGPELVGLPEAELREIRGNDVAMIFQDSPVLAEPDQDDRRAGRRAGPPAPRRPRSKEALERALEVLELVGLPRPRERLRRLPAPALRRPASAGDDRDRARLRAEGAARRRADDRARRDDPGADPVGARRPPRAARDGDAARHPRHGRGRRPHQPDQRDVRRADRRDGRDPRAVQRACATRTPRRCSARSRGSTPDPTKALSPSRASRRT